MKSTIALIAIMVLASCDTTKAEEKSPIDQHPVLARWLMDCFETEGAVPKNKKLSACKNLERHLKSGGIVPPELVESLKRNQNPP